MTDKVARRIRHDLHTPAEVAITKAMEAVEALAPDERLTQSVILLEQARTCVSSYIDEQLRDNVSVAAASTDVEVEEQMTKIFGAP